MLFSCRRFFLSSLIATFFLPCSFTYAIETNLDYFQQGVEAAKAEDYAAAVQAFERAKRAGNQTPALYYNLGVAYYKLRNYTVAERAFKRLREVPEMAALAYYNLGLIAVRKDQDSIAIRYFRSAFTKSQNEKVRAMALIALQRLGVTVAEARREATKWHGLIDLSASNDSNINLENRDLLDGALEQDLVYEIYADANYFMHGLPGDGLRFDAQASFSKHRDYSDNDFTTVQLALSREFRYRQWDAAVEALVQDHSFDGADFLGVLGFEAYAERDVRENSYLQLRYRLSEVRATDNSYDYLSGWRNELRARLYKGAKPEYWRYEYKIQLDDRADYSQPGEFRSYSPTRHVLRVTRFFPIADKLSGHVDLQYRYSLYADDDALTGYAPYRREEHRYRVDFRIDYTYDSDWLLYADFRYTENDSNRVEAITTTPATGIRFINSYSYQRNQITAGAVWTF